jgi:HAD superfamily hydrolase (TIGR01509 family)
MNTEKIKAIIFDMDGVLVDSEPIHEKAEREVCRQFGMEVAKSEWDGFRGRKLDDIFSYASKKYGTGKEPIEEMIELKIQLYLFYALKEMELLPGVREFLDEMKKNQKYRFALTTSGRKIQQNQILAKYQLENFFETMVTADDVKNGKPHPEPYIVTVEKLNEEPGVCLVIEDSDNGIISAKAAGCQTCGITTTFPEDRLKSAGAEMVVSDFYELARILF